ncbi:MAG: type I DNA topoisomerase [Chloroflexi bacterium]|nr:type I DNA topoisomerase [Chloroflexota bacterium]
MSNLQPPTSNFQLPTSKLVIVESPAKARTVGRFLGRGYRVRASIGHIRDLPERQMGVDIEHDFRPRYVITPKKKDVVKELRSDAAHASEVFLATDPDREGEAISWHLAAALDSALRDKPVHRVEFHEITNEAINHAFANPREINQQLVDAQQARRVLDRLVGYTISPLLRKKVSKSNLSAGRVQSVAVRLVVEREREIQAFVPVEYWSIEAELQKQLTVNSEQSTVQPPNHPTTQPPTYPPFRAKLIKIGDKDFECHTGEDALKLKETLEKCAYVVLDVRKKEVQRNPSPPFITSTLQQEASRKLGFNAKRTMATAQQLYEGLSIGEQGNVGLITYMRTDSTNVAESARKEAWAYVKEKFGENFLPKTPRFYAKKVAGAQEAHEAIRPTSTFREPNAIKQYLNADQFRLYDLIWKRFVASQMASAIFDTTAVDIRADEPNHPTTQPPNYLFRANGSILIFRGFLAVYTESKDEPSEDDEGNRILPPLAPQEPLDLLGIYPEQHFTQPPPRYTEASLIKALEELGVGRPSTYAPIMSTIQERAYVERLPDRRLKPTDLGFLVNDLLVKHFPNEVDVGFTALMEQKLDKVAAGEAEWVQVLRDFYAPFKQTLDRAADEMPNVTVPVETTNEVCDKCGSPMVVKHGKFGKFLACSAFPKCRNTRRLSASGGSASTGVQCPECKQGEIVEKKSKKGRIFYSCNRYPNCKFALWDKPIKTSCPQCGSIVVQQKNNVKCTRCKY